MELHKTEPNLEVSANQFEPNMLSFCLPKIKTLSPTLILACFLNVNENIKHFQMLNAHNDIDIKLIYKTMH